MSAFVLGATTVEKPNIVFLLADDLGWADLKCYSSSFYETPNIDQLAREGIWKLIQFFEDQRVELYDLRKDLGEKNDLAKSMSEKAKDLQRRLAAWQKETGAKMPAPN